MVLRLHRAVTGLPRQRVAMAQLRRQGVMDLPLRQEVMVRLLQREDMARVRRLRQAVMVRLQPVDTVNRTKAY
jgi:hypothetical protein